MKTKTLYLQKWDIIPFQSKILQHVHTCNTVPASDGNTSQNQFLELATAVTFHCIELSSHHQIFCLSRFS